LVVRGVATVSSGGAITGQPVGAGLFLYDTAISGGVLNVLSGGSAGAVFVFSGGQLNVLGTITDDVFVESGGTETVSSGGLVLGPAFSATSLFAGGTLNVLAGGTIQSVSIFGAGAYDAGSAVSTSVLSGGFLAVQSGGVTSGTTVSNSVRVRHGERNPAQDWYRVRLAGRHGFRGDRVWRQ
jgi:autotransporter passenger strand-loop-strand repeat protein